MLNDLRWAVRAISRDRVVAAISALTLALGVGANTAMFSVMNALLLRPLPYWDPARLVTLYAEIPSLRISGAFVEYNAFVEYWRTRCRSFDSLMAHTPRTYSLTSGGEAQRVHGVRVSAGLFRGLGVAPALGRDFRDDEDRPGGQRVAMLSDALWRTRFGATPSAVGSTIVLDREPYQVVGIAPPGFDLFTDEAAVYVPIAASAARAEGMPSVGAYARLKPGVPIESAQAEMDAISKAWVQDRHYPPGYRIQVTRLHDYFVRDVRSSVVVLSFAVGFVLLIACANVAHLLLARAGAREREMAIRSAIGGTPGRIARQLLVESALLAAAGSALGLAAAWGTAVALRATDQRYLPLQNRVQIDGTVLLFAAAAAVATTILFGMAPALAAVRANVAGLLNEAGRGGSEAARQKRVRAALIVAEVALAVVLTIGASLTATSLARLRSVNLEFRPEGVLTAEVTLPPESYPKPEQRLAYFRALSDRARSMPGVDSAGLVSHLPFSNSKSGGDVNPEGTTPSPDAERIIAFHRAVDPGYFAAIGARLVRGRFIDAQDSRKNPVAVVNEAFARRCWPGRDAVGKRFRHGREGPWVTVAGVIADMRQMSPADLPDMESYEPYDGLQGGTMALAVRTSADPRTLEPALRAAARELDRDVPLSKIASLPKAVANATRSRAFSATLFGLFAGLALFLASVGIYGVVSHSVARRTREMGIRVALGASRREIVGLVVGRAVLLAGLGVSIGVAAALGLTRLLKSMLYGISATDPVTFAAVAVAIVGVAAAAAWAPARRAGRVDPIEALRAE